MHTNERMWLETNKKMVDRVVFMVRDHHMRGGYGGDLDLVGIERLLKNLLQKLTEYTSEIEKLRKSDEENTESLKTLRNKLEVYDKVFSEFSPANQKIIKRIQERVEEECKLQQ